MSLGALDWLVILVFVAAIAALGFSAKLRNNSVLEYLTAGRNLSLTAFIATLVSTWYGGILGVGESVSFFGVGAWLLIGVPYYVFAILYALWLAPRVRDADQISLPERLAQRWGKNVGLLGAVLIFILAVPAAHVLMLGSLISQFSGLGLGISVVLGAGIGAALLYKGGLLADVRMCLLAFIGMYVGFAVMAGYCLITYPPAEAFQAIEPKSLLSFTGGATWPMIISFFILGAWTFVDPAFHQRVASAASPTIGRRGVLISVFFWFLFDVLSITSALYALALLQPLPEKLAIYPALAEQVLPPGLKALFLCGALGTIASAMVGYTLVSGATIGREFVARLVPSMPEQQVKAWVRAGLILALVVAVPVGLSINSVVDLWYSWAGAMIGAMLIPVVGSYAKRSFRASPTFVFTAMLVAAISSMVWLIHGQRTNNPYLDVVLMKMNGNWSLRMAPVPETIHSAASESITFGVGTLLPGLVISALILGVGEIAARRKNS